MGGRGGKLTETPKLSKNCIVARSVASGPVSGSGGERMEEIRVPFEVPRGTRTQRGRSVPTKGHQVIPHLQELYSFSIRKDGERQMNRARKRPSQPNADRGEKQFREALNDLRRTRETARVEGRNSKDTPTRPRGESETSVAGLNLVGTEGTLHRRNSYLQGVRRGRRAG